MFCTYTCLIAGTAKSGKRFDQVGGRKRYNVEGGREEGIQKSPFSLL
jgi:hypothetical protein